MREFTETINKSRIIWFFLSWLVQARGRKRGDRKGCRQGAAN